MFSSPRLRKLKGCSLTSARRVGQARIRTCSVWPWSRIASLRSVSGRANPRSRASACSQASGASSALVAERERCRSWSGRGGAPADRRTRRARRAETGALRGTRRLVAGDRQQRDVGMKAAADLGEAREVAGVAGQVEAQCGGPARLAGPRPRTRRRRAAGNRRAAPPEWRTGTAVTSTSPRSWLLPGSSSTMSAKPRPRTRRVQRGGTTSTALPRHPHDAGPRQVIAVGVRHQHQIDVVQIVFAPARPPWRAGCRRTTSPAADRSAGARAAVVIIAVAWPTKVIDTVPAGGRGTGAASTRLGAAPEAPSAVVR